MRRTLLLLSLSAVSLLACSSSSSPPPSDSGNPPPNKWVSVVGASGTFAQTFDEASWQARSLGDASLFGVACVGNYVGWAVGAHGTIGHTVDGGRTWAWQSSGVSADLHGVRFGDTLHGLAVGDGGTLVVTSDGGANWTSVSATAIDLHAAMVAWGAGSFFAAGAHGTFLRSIDGGAHFTVSTIAGAANLRGVASDVAAHVVLVVDDAGAIFSSDDGGVSFARDVVAPAPLDAVSIDDGGGPAIAVGAHGTVMLRDPIARTWSSIGGQTTSDLHAALVLQGGDRFYVAGDGGTLLTRRGESGVWQAVPLATNATLYGLEDL